MNKKIYDLILKNKYLSAEEVMSELSISRATVFRHYANIKRITGVVFDKKNNATLGSANHSLLTKG